MMLGCSRPERSATTSISDSSAARTVGGGAPARVPFEELPPTDVGLPSAVEVPLLEVTGRPAVEARLNGRGPYRFAIETGAHFVALTPRVVAEAKLPRVGGNDEEPLVRIDTLSIGAARFSPITAVQFQFADRAIDGILGLNLYAEVLLTVDPTSRRVRFERGSLPPVDGREVLALKTIGELIGTDITIGGQPFIACVDTRGAGQLTLMPELAATVEFVGSLRESGYARGAAIPRTPKKIGRLKGDVRIGAYTVQHPIVLVHSTPPNFPQVPILGSELLKHFTLTLDQKHARVRFHRATPVVPPPPDPKNERPPAKP